MSREVDVEKPYNKTEVVAKLRRLADALEQEKAFEIQIAGHRVYLPAKAAVTVENTSGRTQKRKLRLR